MCTCVKAGGPHPVTPLRSHLPWLLKESLSLGLRFANDTGLSGYQVPGSARLHLSSPGTAGAHALAHSHGFWGPNASPHACKGSTLPTEPSLYNV